MGEVVDELVSPFADFEVDSADDNDAFDGDEDSDNEICDVEGGLKPYRDSRKGQIYLLNDWYMRPAKICEVIFGELDILRKQAALLVFKKDYKKAFDVNKRVLLDFKHNLNHKKEVVDALVHCAAKAGFKDELNILFSALKGTVETLGDQINFWTTTVMVGELDPEGRTVTGKEHFKAVVNLVSLMECGRHWLLFDKVSTDLIPKKCNFRLGAKVRAFFWLKSEFKTMNQPSDSTETLTERQLVKLKAELQRDYTEAELAEAKRHIWANFIRSTTDKKDEETAEEPPAHACKLGGREKSVEEIEEMRQRFVSLYPWLFEGLENVSKILLEKEVFEEADGVDVDALLDELR